MNEKMQIVDDISNNTSYEAIRIEAGTIQGVNIPCILCMPKQVNGKQKLTVIFNNENGQTLEESIGNMQNGLIGAMNNFEFSSPVLVPILPSQLEFNQTLQADGIDLKVGEPKQFAQECFSSKIPEQCRFYRLDEQVNSLIQNIIKNPELKEQIQELRENGEKIDFDEKVIGFGHSGAGASMLRYCLLHPEMLETLIIGGNGDIVPTPMGENGKKLPYPFGIADYTELFGREFDIESFKKVAFQFYIGDREDEIPRFDTIRDDNYLQGGTGNNFAPEAIAKVYKQLYGTPFFERFLNVLKEYEKNGINIGLKIYENDCHTPIQSADLKGIISGEKHFEGKPSKQLEEMLEKRKNMQNIGENVDNESILGSAIESTEESTRTSTINEQVGNIKQLTKSKDEKSKGMEI